jgi:hypothetical protein
MAGVGGVSWAVIAGGGLVAAGLVAALVLALLAKRSGGGARGVARDGAKVTQAADSEGDVRRMSEVVAALAAELDGRAARLEALIARAEEVADRLDRANAAAERGAARGRRGDEVAARGDGAVAVASESHRAGDAGELDEASAAVVRLARAGLTPVQIAQKLGVQTGQVELMLSLARVGKGG